MPRRKPTSPLPSAPKPELEPLLTMMDVERILQLSKPKIYELMHRGLPSLKLDGARRFERVRLLEWIEQQRQVS